MSQVQEYGLSLNIAGASLTPKKVDVYYDKDMAFNRAIVLAALGAYIEGKESVYNPIRCVDAISGIGTAGLLWNKFYGNKCINVTLNDARELGYKLCKENAACTVEVTSRDVSILLLERSFNFIFLDCYGPSTPYLDSVFRNCPKNGILIVSTTDDASLYGKAPDATLKNYGGSLAKTFYSKELAVRLVLAAIVRSAAKCNKGITVLCSVAAKGFFTIIVKATRGSTSATNSLNLLRRLIHCTVCEDRAFYPQSSYVLDDPYNLLHCDCHGKLPGSTGYELGPLWSGDIFSVKFVLNMLECCKQLELDSTVQQTLEVILSEAKCERQEPFLHDVSCPPFYYNLHRHSTKGIDLLKTSAAVELLKKKGSRASRTHFDSEAVRTDVPLPQLIALLSAK